MAKATTNRNLLTNDTAQKLMLEHTLIGRVIIQATQIEQMINAYIAEFYTRHSDADYQASYLAFIYDIMNARGLSLNTKVDVLLKIYVRMFGEKNKPSKTLFENWLNVRNKFAHGTYIADSGILYGGEFFDVVKLADKHAKLQQRINVELEKFSNLWGPYFNQIPTKEWEKK